MWPGLPDRRMILHFAGSFFAVMIMQRLLCGNDCADICFMQDHSFNAAIILRTAILWGRVLSRTR